MEFTVRLADVNIKVTSIYSDVYDLCKDYLTDGEPELKIEICQDDIDYEKVINIREAQIEGRLYITNIQHYTLLMDLAIMFIRLFRPSS